MKTREPSKPDTDAREKTKLMLKHGFQPAVIGIQIPKRFKNMEQSEIFRNLKNADDFKYITYSPDRFPKSARHRGYLSGTLADISKVARMLSVPTAKISVCVGKLKSVIEDASNQIARSGPDVRHNIAFLIRQPPVPQTWKIAGLIVSNALVFHSMIAGTNKIPNLEKLRGVDRQIDIGLLFRAWDLILCTNYYAIFQVAKDILRELNPREAARVINELAKVAEYIHARNLTTSTDMYGMLIQEVIPDRDTLKAFYTRSESAVLLAGLTVPPHGDSVYDDAKNFTLADFACGTGTLLAAAYRQFGANYEAAGGSMREIHTHMMENRIIGYDVLPSATHLAVSCLASLFPEILFKMSRIGKIDFGKFETPDGGVAYRLGSLDLIDSDTTFDPNITLIGGQSEEAHFNSQIDNTSCNLILMNPPFTSNTKSDEDRLAMFASFGIARNDQDEMAEIAKKKFAGTCMDGRAGYPTHFMAITNKKLQYGGTLGFVIPSTVANGVGYAGVRSMLAERYEKVMLVSISGDEQGRRSFSADTSIGEALLVAKKLDKATIEEIKHLKADIEKSRRRIAYTSKKIKDMECGVIPKNPKRRGGGGSRPKTTTTRDYA